MPFSSEFIKEQLIGYSYSGGDIPNKQTKITATCLTCGLERSAQFRDFLRKNCRTCTYAKIKQEKSKVVKLPTGYSLVAYESATLPITIKCPLGHVYKISLKSAGESTHSCATCKITTPTSKEIEEFSKHGWSILEKSKSLFVIQCKTCLATKYLPYKERKRRLVCAACRQNEDFKNRENEVKKWLRDHNFTYLGGFKNVDAPLKVKCSADHEYETTFWQLSKAKKCVHCAGTANDNIFFKEKIKQNGWEYLDGKYIDSKSPLTAMCLKCGSSYTKSYSQFISSGCVKCQANNRLRWKDEKEIETYLQENRPHILLRSYNYSLKRPIANLACGLDNYKWSVDWYSFYSEGRDCPKCKGVAKVTWQQITEACSKRGYALVSKELEKYNIDTLLPFKCVNGHLWETTPHRIYLSKADCPQCNAERDGSKCESDFADWVSTLGIPFTRSQRILNPYEIDVYFEGIKIGVELNGIYFHSTAIKKDIGYHKRKYEMAFSKGIKLIQIWEDEWVRKKDIVKSIISNKLNVGNSKKIYARDCRLEQLGQNEARHFLEENHLQGGCAFVTAWGLIHENDIVAVMTIKNHRTLPYLELNRFCVKKYTNVVGGFAKLLAKTSKPLVTYSDNRISSGEIYLKNNFILDANLKPNFEWVKGLTRFSKKEILTKHKIQDFNEIEDLGYNRLYDAGKKRWLLI